jgi:hypothetical protein
MLANQHRFHRSGRWTFLASLWVCFAGCSICPSPYDDDYGTYGTKTPRTNMRHGRVGSPLSESAYAHGDHQVVGFPESVLSEEILDEGMDLGPGEIIIQ